MEKLPKLSVHELGLKARSKSELYKLLNTTVNIYLPPKGEANAKYLSDIISGNKKFLYGNEIKFYQIPKVQGLSVRHIMGFARKHLDLQVYLPTYTKNRVPNRDWLINIVHSVIPEKFEEWVNSQMKKRQNRLLEDNNMYVDALPEIIDKIKGSEEISVTRGRSNLLMSRSTKRMKLPHEDYEEVKMEQDVYKQHILLSDKIEKLKYQLEKANTKLGEHMKDTDILQNLYQMNIIDKQGNPIEKHQDMEVEPRSNRTK